MNSVPKKLLLTILLIAGWVLGQAQPTGSPSQRLKLVLVDNKSTFVIENEQNHYVNTLRFSQPDSPYQLTADMLYEGDNIISVKRIDDKGNQVECARINLKTVFNASTAVINPAVSYFIDNSWSAEQPTGNTITCQRDESIDLTTVEFIDDFYESTAGNLHPDRYEYSASMDANILLPDPNIPVILTPDHDIDMGAETSVETLVSGYYLTQPATLTTTGPLEVNPSTLAADQVNNGTMVTITFTGSNHSGNGTLTITSGTTTRTVAISHRSAPPMIIANPTTVNISNGATSGTFSVHGTDLAGPITIIGDANFSVSHTSISMEEAMAGDITVTITPKSNIYGTITGTIILTSPDAEPVTVQVTYDAPFYASIDFSKCTTSDPTSAEITGHNGWGLTNVKIYQPGNVCAYLNRSTSFTYTMPSTFTGNRVYVTVTSDTGNDGAGVLLVNNVSHTFTSGSSYTWSVNVSAGGTITFSAPNNSSYSVDISKIVISAANSATMNKPKVVNHTHKGESKTLDDPHGLTINQEKR